MVQQPQQRIAPDIGRQPMQRTSMAQFNPSSKHPARALQAWVILVGAAMNRQTLTYLGLSQLMYQRKAAGVLEKILGHIAFYCIEQDLPPMTASVVGKGRGTPGQDIPLDARSLDGARERVYAYDWYDEYPPTEDQLAAAMKTAVTPAVEPAGKLPSASRKRAGT